MALEFLPKAVCADPGLLARFHAEVRPAREVSHPNVCRVYDIADIEGQHFLNMEYVDGEDLASLLKRIGHLPADKALEAPLTQLVRFVRPSGQENPLIEMAGGAVIAPVLLAVFFRGDLLGLAVAFEVFRLLPAAPLTPVLSPWFAGYGLACLALVLAVGVYGFWAARGGADLSGVPSDE